MKSAVHLGTGLSMFKQALKLQSMAKPSKKPQPGVERGTSDTPGKAPPGTDPGGIAWGLDILRLNQTCQTRHKMCHLTHFMSRLRAEFESEEAVWCCGIEV